MTPNADAIRHKDYLTALRALGVSHEESLAMTIAYIQADAMRQMDDAPPTHPKPKLTR